MPLMMWNSSFSVGVKKFDADHQQLFLLVNELNDAMRAGKAKSILRDVLNALIVYTVQHFTSEEKEMKRTGYPEYEAHAEEHRKLTAEVNDIARQYEEGNTLISVDLLIFLRDWLQDHVLGSDKKYTSHLNAKGVC